MDHAITTLQIALDTARNNEPIHRAEGNIVQADACLAHADELGAGLAALTLVSKGLIVLPKEVTPHQEYRMLEAGDVIQEGDEMLCYNKGPWEPALVENHGAKLHLGYVKHRRPVKRSLENPPQSDNVPL